MGSVDGDTAQPSASREDRPRAAPPGAQRAKSGPGAAFALARTAYLRGESIDMSALAAQLGVGRATLYRWVGNREQLLGAVLAEATARTFRSAVRDVDDATRGRLSGADRLLAIFDRVVRSVLAAQPLKVLTQREPLLFVRLATSPGAIESRSAELIRELLDAEVAAGHLDPHLPVPVLARALVRMIDGPMYAHLLGGGEPGIDEALAVAGVLLGIEHDARPPLTRPSGR